MSQSLGKASDDPQCGNFHQMLSQTIRSKLRSAELRLYCLRILENRSATDMVATVRRTARSLSVEKRFDEISATGGRQIFSPLCTAGGANMALTTPGGANMALSAPVGANNPTSPYLRIHPTAPRRLTRYHSPSSFRMGSRVSLSSRATLGAAASFQAYTAVSFSVTNQAGLIKM